MWYAISFAGGFVAGPIVVVAALWFLRDTLPPTIFMPSDWDR